MKPPVNLNESDPMVKGAALTVTSSESTLASLVNTHVSVVEGANPLTVEQGTWPGDDDAWMKDSCWLAVGANGFHLGISSRIWPPIGKA